MLHLISCCNDFGGYEDPVEEMIACRTDKWTSLAACVSGVFG